MQELQDKNAFYNSIQLGEVSRELLENNGQNFDYSTYVATYVEFVNTSDKVITGIKGAVIFKNNFGDILYSLNVAEDNISLAPHGSYIYSHKRDSIFADERYINADLSDLQIVFQGEQLLFDDGTKLVLEQAIW